MSLNRNHQVAAHQLRAVADLIEHDALTVALVEVCGWEKAAKLDRTFSSIAAGIAERLRVAASRLELRH